MEPTANCCICNNSVEEKTDDNGVIYWNQGENAMPVAEGRCCDKCNWDVVIPARLGTI